MQLYRNIIITQKFLYISYPKQKCIFTCMKLAVDQPSIKSSLFQTYPLYAFYFFAIWKEIKKIFLVLIFSYNELRWIVDECDTSFKMRQRYAFMGNMQKVRKLFNVYTMKLSLDKK